MCDQSCNYDFVEDTNIPINYNGTQTIETNNVIGNDCSAASIETVQDMDLLTFCSEAEVENSLDLLSCSTVGRTLYEMPVQDDATMPTQDDATMPTSSGIMMSPEESTQLSPAQNENGTQFAGHPFAEITEQPTPVVKFRYISENRAEPIYGTRNTVNQKTWPTIKISNYEGPAFVVVYCVTADLPYRVHPHMLCLEDNVNGNVSDNGIVVFNKTIWGDDNVLQLNIKVQCVKRHEVQNALKQRKKARVLQLSTLEIDSFGHEFDHAETQERIDLKKIRLVFHVFVSKDDAWHSLEPIVSDVISKSPRLSGVPNIKYASHSSGSMAGGTNFLLLLSKMVDHTDLEMIFYEINDAKQVIWKSKATILAYYEENKAILAVTPAYTRCPGDLMLRSPIDVWFYLRKISTVSNNELCSQSMPFKYISDATPLPSLLPSHPPRKTKKVRLRRSITNSGKASEKTTNEVVQTAESDTALSETLAHLSIKS